MTREEYLNIRRVNAPILILNKYNENFDSSKHHPRLSQQELFMFLQMWGSMDAILESVIKEYDQKFGVMHVIDQNGRYIKSI